MEEEELIKDLRLDQRLPASEEEEEKEEEERRSTVEPVHFGGSVFGTRGLNGG